eukprot:3018527-Amphidinium_carterae.1
MQIQKSAPRRFAPPSYHRHLVEKIYGPHWRSCFELNSEEQMHRNLEQRAWTRCLFKVSKCSYGASKHWCDRDAVTPRLARAAD